jgi:PAS domain-containing protein
MMFLERCVSLRLAIPWSCFSHFISSQYQSDDIDFNEVFADYFINEFNDPINAYTSSMANYNGVTVPMEQDGIAPNSVMSAAPTQAARVTSNKAQPSPATLPTGGIRTVFHSHSGVAKSGVRHDVHSHSGVAQGGIRHDVHSHSGVAQGGIRHDVHSHSGVAQGGVRHDAPATKKHKVEPAMITSQAYQHGNAMPQPHLAHPGMMASQQQGNQLAASVAAPPPGESRKLLPVGVGIRLGGVGGIAPATAQSAPRAPGAQAQYSMWGMQDEGASDHVVAERRQRNREHAKRSRVRKKFMLEALQGQVRMLQKENQDLRMLVQEHIPGKAMEIISECCTNHPFFDDPDQPETGQGSKEDFDRPDLSLVRSLATGQKCFVLSDPKLPDNPIVFASEGFYQMTGYTSKEVLGRNCRLLQGPGTNPKGVDIIRKAVATGSDATVCLLNYKADGTPFWNQFFLAALRDQDNCIVNYVRIVRRALMAAYW